MYNHTPSDPVQVRELGTLQTPATCAVCGNATCLDGYLDIGVWIEYHGQIYLCMNCAKQAAEVIGCLVPEEHAHLKELSDSLAKELADLKEEHGHVLSRVAVYDSLITGVLAPSDFIGSTGEVTEAPEGPNAESPKPAGTGESVAKKSVKSRRPNDPAQSTVRDEPGTFAI